jgi:hypothetical protein
MTNTLAYYIINYDLKSSMTKASVAYTLKLFTTVIITSVS